MTKAEADRLLRNALERYRKGDIEAARRVYENVLAAHPDHPAALHYMALVAHHAGQTGEAVDLLRRSIRLDPKDPRAYNHLGQMVLAQKQVHEAIACFRRAIDVDPRHGESINNLANVLALTGQQAQAIELYRRALELNPRALSSLYNLASALKHEPASAEAADLFRQALEVQPDHVPSHHDLAVLLERQGRFDEAIDHYLAVLRLQPRHAMALANLMSIRSYAPGEAMVRTAEELSSSTNLTGPGPAAAPASLPDDDRVKLHHGLGRHYERQRRYEDAFAQFSAAKAMVRRRTEPFDESTLAVYFDRIIATFSPDFFGRYPAGGSSSERSVFIVGMPRSGTTLVEQILASHPSVFGAGEQQGILDVVRVLRPDYPQRVPDLSAAEIADFAKGYLATIEAVAPPEAARVTDKLPVNFIHLGLISSLFPHARVVHCRRDPLDTALSCFTELFRLRRDFTTDLENIGRYYVQYDRLMTHWRRTLPLQMLEVRYEDLIAAPEAGARALIAHCTLPWDDACLDFQSTQRSIATPSRWQVRQPIYASSVGRWRHYERHLTALRRLLEERGYGSDTG